MFYKQLLPAQISKAQKDTVDLTVFLRFWDLRTQKLCVNMLVKFTPGLNFMNILGTAFTRADPESIKRF